MDSNPYPAVNFTMALPLPTDSKERKDWIEKNLHPTRGHIRSVNPPQRKSGRLESEYIKALGELGIKEEWILCVTFPNGKILIYFYSTFDREARKVMERIADVKVFDRSIEAVYGVF